MALRTAWKTLALGLTGAMAACGPSMMPADGGDVQTTHDVPMMGDVPTMGDVPMVGDGGDGGGPTACGTVMVQSLDGMGMMGADGATHFMLNNDSANMSMTAGIQPGTQLQTFCAYHTAYEQVFTYTMQHAAALRVSTSNPGTGSNFDTTVTLADSCVPSLAANTHFLGCNDDDPTFGAGEQRHVSSTAVTIRTIAAGHTVYIAVGGFAPSDAARQHGAYELSIQELTPVADGMACDVQRLTNACGDSSTCVGPTPSDLHGTCQPDGTVAGSACLPASGTMPAHCTGMNLTCDSTLGLCVNNAVAAGMPCDAFNDCAPGATCISPVRGLGHGTCVTDGTAVGGPCGGTAGMTCSTGLTCTTPPGATSAICLHGAVPAGMACNISDSTCATGNDCVATQGPDSTAGTCATAGSQPGTTCPGGACMGGLTCSATNNDCVHQSMAGGACGLYQECGTGTNCFLTNDVADQIHATCNSNGALGGQCPTSGSCMMGTCSNPTDPANGTCVLMASSGGMCDFQHACPTGETCVRTNTGNTAFAGTCHAEGTAPGAACRRTGMACDGSMHCSSYIPDEGVCQNAGTMGGACNPRTATTACPTGSACRATALETGTCAAPTASEPATGADNNDTPSAVMSMTAATGPALFTGALPIGDVDCYHVAAPTGMHHFFASVNEPSGLCPGIGVTLTLDLYQLSGTEARLIATDSTSGGTRCPRLDAGDPYGNFSFLPSLPTGDYYLCVRNTDTTTPQQNLPAYALSVNVAP